MDVDENGDYDLEDNQFEASAAGHDSVATLEPAVASKLPTIQLAEQGWTVGSAWKCWMCNNNGDPPLRIQLLRCQVTLRPHTIASALRTVMAFICAKLQSGGVSIPDDAVSEEEAQALLEHPAVVGALPKMRCSLARTSLHTARVHVNRVEHPDTARSCKRKKAKNVEGTEDSGRTQKQARLATEHTSAVDATAEPDVPAATAASAIGPWCTEPFPGNDADAVRCRAPPTIGKTDQLKMEKYSRKMGGKFRGNWEANIRQSLWSHGRLLLVVSADGNCLFHTLAAYTNIPASMLRWLTAVRVAVELYWCEDGDQGLLSSLQTRPGSEAASAQQLIEGILIDGRSEEQCVVSMACKAIALPLAVMACYPKKDASRWNITVLQDTDRNGVQHHWESGQLNPSIRLAVNYGNGESAHFSPSALATPVPASSVAKCRTAEEAVENIVELLLQRMGEGDVDQCIPGTDVMVCVSRDRCCACM